MERLIRWVRFVGQPFAPTANTARQIQIGLRLLF
jgi:hypothetical protein